MSEEFTIDWPHGHQTRNGRPARVICTDTRGGHPITALLLHDDGHEVATAYTIKGRLLHTGIHEYDIVNKPAPMPIWWVSVYDGGKGLAIHRGQVTAQECASEGRLAYAITLRDGRIVDVTDEQDNAR